MVRNLVYLWPHITASADFIDICINRRHITGDNLNVLLMPVGFNEIDVFPSLYMLQRLMCAA